MVLLTFEITTIVASVTVFLVFTLLLVGSYFICKSKTDDFRTG